MPYPDLINLYRKPKESNDVFMNVLILIVMTCIVVPVLLYRLFPLQVAGLLQRMLYSQCGLTSRTISVDGIDWPYLEGGNPDGETMVLVHGFGANKDNWPLYARKLIKDYYIICPDLPGFGDNTADPALSYHTQAQAERLNAFIRALGINRCHLAGNSMGGMITLRYALSFPEQLHTITLFNNAGVSGSNKSELELGVEQGKNLLSISTMEDLDALMTFVVHQPRKIPMPIKKLMYSKAKQREALHQSIFEGLTKELEAAPLEDQLANISVPTLIIWGKYDRLIDVSCTEKLRTAIPRNECIIMEDTGHMPMIERPRESAAAQRQFLQALGG